MFNKEIEFSAHESYVNLNEDFPTPIKTNIPEWFKNLNHSVDRFTIKGCLPFLDTLTTGYLLKLPMDIRIAHNFINSENKIDSIYRIGPLPDNIMREKGININRENPAPHMQFQVEGSPFVEKNKNLPFYKIMNPWKIKTPKGYSCLFVPPLNNSDDRFQIMSGIVDTDTFVQEINFPIVLNGDKYPVLDTILKKGTPYVQIIPFRRDNWKMKISKKTTEEVLEKKNFYYLEIMYNYKNRYWKKKNFK
jgi:hypothetical protein